jgi:Ca2+-transporting ATPase
MSVMSNLYLYAAVEMSTALQLAVVYFPPAQRLFETVPLSGRDLAACIVASTVIFWAVEVEKLFRRRRPLSEEGIS